MGFSMYPTEYWDDEGDYEDDFNWLYSEEAVVNIDTDKEEEETNV